MILIWLLALVLPGCVYGPPLQSDEFGKAVRCHWIGTYPFFCSYDKSRVTVDTDELENTLERLEKYQTQEYQRRQL